MESKKKKEKKWKEKHLMRTGPGGKLLLELAFNGSCQNMNENDWETQKGTS